MATPGPAIGELIGDYRVLRKLGEGGMGVVYLAEDVRLGRKVALKTLARDFAGDAERRRRFLNEARAAAAFNHANVAAVYELEERGEDVFIIFEYVEGRTLRSLIESRGLALEQLLSIAAQIAAALEAAHAKGIVHRDLKPENVMLSPSGDVKVLDFGLARFDSGVLGGVSATQSFGLTQAGTVMGTVGYMSPEQLEGKPTDFRSDIFSFGVLVYELAAGTHPFAGATPASTIANVMTQEPPPLTATEALHPPELERIVRKCLRKARDERYQSTRELLVDLKNLKRDSDSSQAVTAPVTLSAPATGARRVLGVSVTPRLWWLLHSLFFLAYVPLPVWMAWRMREWAGTPESLVLLFAEIVALSVAVLIRLVQLNFALWTPDALPEQVRRTAPWLTVANASAMTLLLLMTFGVFREHTGFAAIVAGMCVVGLGAVFLYEPTMLRHAFPGTEPFLVGRGDPPKHIAGIQWIYLLLLSSPLVNFAFDGSDPLVDRALASPAVGRVVVAAAALVLCAAGTFAAVWSAEAFQGKVEAMRALRRRFALFVAFDYAALALWTAWLASNRHTPRPLYFMLLLLAYLPFHQLKLARAIPGSDVVEAEAVPATRKVAVRLAILQALTGAPFLLMLFLGSKLLTDSQMQASMRQGMPDWVVRLMPGLMVAIPVVALLVCGGTAIDLLRAPEIAARRLQRFFPVFALLGFMSGWMWTAALMGLVDAIGGARASDTFFPFLGPLLPVGGVLVAFYQRRTALALAPPEASAKRLHGLTRRAWWWANNWFLIAGYLGLPFMAWYVRNNCVEWWQTGPNNLAFVAMLICVFVPLSLRIILAEVGAFTPEDLAGKLRSFRPALRFFVVSHAALVGLMAPQLSVARYPLLVPILLMVAAVILVYGFVFEPIVERAAFPGIAAAGTSASRESTRSPAQRRAFMLSAIHALFALMFGALSGFTTDLMRRIFVEPGWETHHQVVAVVRASLAVIGFLLSAGFAVQTQRSPETASRRFVQLFPAILLLNILGGVLAGILSAVFLGSYLLAVVLPIVIVPLSFYARSLARELSPAEPRAPSDFSFRRPETWWVAHQFANLLVLAPWVGYWGSLTRGYYPPFGKLAFFILVLLVGARWALHFVLVCVWTGNRAAAAATWQRVSAPLRYVGFGIVATMLVEAGMAAANDQLVFGSLLGALAMGGLVSVVYIEPLLVPPGSDRGV